ncbi:hypothetical protein M422DRAFT_243233 [Sphaerobolus stellatus SS14]|nr:hypothetical protein M422DRAFT_243233 [Sphaerobolus stellatus SS14]
MNTLSSTSSDDDTVVLRRAILDQRKQRQLQGASCTPVGSSTREDGLAIMSAQRLLRSDACSLSGLERCDDSGRGSRVAFPTRPASSKRLTPMSRGPPSSYASPLSFASSPSPATPLFIDGNLRGLRSMMNTVRMTPSLVTPNLDVMDTSWRKDYATHVTGLPLQPTSPDAARRLDFHPPISPSSCSGNGNDMMGWCHPSHFFPGPDQKQKLEAVSLGRNVNDHSSVVVPSNVKESKNHSPPKGSKTAIRGPHPFNTLGSNSTSTTFNTLRSNSVSPTGLTPLLRELPLSRRLASPVASQAASKHISYLQSGQSLIQNPGNANRTWLNGYPLVEEDAEESLASASHNHSCSQYSDMQGRTTVTPHISKVSLQEGPEEDILLYLR